MYIEVSTNYMCVCVYIHLPINYLCVLFWAIHNHTHTFFNSHWQNIKRQ